LFKKCSLKEDHRGASRMDRLREIENKINLISESRDYLMLKSNTRRELEDKEKKLDQARKMRRLEMKKVEEKMLHEEKVRKNQEKEKKQLNLKRVVARGAVYKRSDKPAIKVVVEDSDHDSEYEDMVRYGLI
jgi:hypothetical protein